MQSTGGLDQSLWEDWGTDKYFRLVCSLKRYGVFKFMITIPRTPLRVSANADQKGNRKVSREQQI